MSIFFEIADLSFELKDTTMDLVTPDIQQFFKETMTDGYQKIHCQISFVEEYEPANGRPLIQDPYCTVLENNGLEIRIFFFEPFASIYGVSHELSADEMLIQTTRKIIDMRFLELLCFERYLLRQNAFILHSCYIEHKGNGIAFTAPSGTGKSTQGSLWEQNANATVVNGDRSILQWKDDTWYIHSLPFCGSSITNKNISCPLKAVAIVNRDSYNHVGPIHKEEDLIRIMNEITVNKWNWNSVQYLLHLVENLLESNLILNLYCTPQAEACHALKEYLYHD